MRMIGYNYQSPYPQRIPFAMLTVARQSEGATTVRSFIKHVYGRFGPGWSTLGPPPLVPLNLATMRVRPGWSRWSTHIQLNTHVRTRARLVIIFYKTFFYLKNTWTTWTTPVSSSVHARLLVPGGVDHPGPAWYHTTGA